ncbi:MAG: type II toxin-antitoxin system VapC family toxin [Chloroflexota bacterium]|nr:type II toxin-antitoxin system VapC family toxin [Chloroflexota bacterium]MDE2933973.1 type II toxin-antitoxin system VapC family toxin [Chloroflexota bacterium]
MAVVIDASIAAAWCFPDEESALGTDALALDVADDAMIVPGVFWYEIRNALIRAERRGRIDAAGSGSFLAQLGELRPEVDTDHDEARTLDLARRYTLTFYDAAYLETAMRRDARLATLDGALATAAAREGVLVPVT